MEESLKYLEKALDPFLNWLFPLMEAHPVITTLVLVPFLIYCSYTIGYDFGEAVGHIVK